MTALRVGLTGGIGSGKSSVARMLASYGAIVIDADVLAREAVAPGTPGLAAVVAEFGTDMLRSDGSLDRGRLAEIVFTHPDRLGALNAIVHPLVARRAAELLAVAPPDSVVVHDVPLLVESEFSLEYDVVVVVEAPLETRVRRLVENRGMTEAEARARIAAQASSDQRRGVADVVVDNSGSLPKLQAQVERLRDHLWRRSTPPSTGFEHGE